MDSRFRGNERSFGQPAQRSATGHAHPDRTHQRATARRPEAALAEPMRVSAFGVSGPNQAAHPEPVREAHSA